MLKRKITNSIQDWYINSKSALLIDGARQTGKTTIIREFLKNSTKSYVELNLVRDKLALEAFNTSNDVEDLLLRITALAGKTLKSNETVIFIDEIQEAKDAITPIKFLVADNRYRYIFSGSLLGVAMKDIQSIPVGFLKTLKMYPLDFEEFLDGLGISLKTKKYLEDCFSKREAVDEIIHKQMLSVFNTYLIVGGMPEAVQTFIDTKNIQKVNNVFDTIDQNYKRDIGKYDKQNKLLIDDIYDLIPSELNSQNKRFVMKNMNARARFYQYEESFVWLKNSGVGLFVHNIDNLEYPLLASKERTLFKLFLCDTGLLSYKLFKNNQVEVLNGETKTNCGAIYESFVAQELFSRNISLFYNNDKKRGEIDFLIEEGSSIIPIEVKSGKDYKRHNALSNILENNNVIHKGYVLSHQNVEVQDKRIYLPIYFAMFIGKNQMDQKEYTIPLNLDSLI